MFLKHLRMKIHFWEEYRSKQELLKIKFYFYIYLYV